MRYSSKRHITAVTAALRPIYQAPTLEAAASVLDELEAGEIGQRYPAIPKAWRAAREEFTPFLACPLEIRRVFYTTNMIESLNARLRKPPATAAHSPPSRPRWKRSTSPSAP